MTPVIPHSSSPISIVPRSTFNGRKNCSLIRCRVLKSYAKRTSYPQNCIVPLSASDRLFPHIRMCDFHRQPLLKVVSASGADVAVAESDTAVADQDSSESEIHIKRARTGRKSDLPPVEDEELVPGATFTGKVRSIQPFGAFVDIGAFTVGLVHVSQLSDNFVKDVGDVVSVGEEVQVRLLEANIKTGRVSLSMRTSDSSAATADSDRKGSPRKNSQSSNQRRDGLTNYKFEEGQDDLEGKVKNLTKKEVPLGIVYAKTSPFLSAFRKNKDIAAYLEEREKEIKKAEALKNAEKIAAQNIVGESVLTSSDVLSSEESVSSLDKVAESLIRIPDVIEVKSDGGSIIDEVQTETSITEAADSSTPPVENEKAEVDEESITSSSLEDVNEG